jgi:hypothetical protein
MPTQPYISYQGSLIRDRAQTYAQQRATAYGLELAAQDRARSTRNLNFDLQGTDQTYLTPFAQRGLTNSGYALTGDNRYRTSALYARADIEQQYQRQRNELLQSLAQQQQNEALNRLLGLAQLTGQLTDQQQAQLNALGG